MNNQGLTKTQRRNRKKRLKKKANKQILARPIKRTQKKKVKRVRVRDNSDLVSVNFGKMARNDQIYNALGRSQNQYLHQIVDPENAVMAGIPDGFTKMTGISRPVINLDLTYLLAPYGDTPGGTYLVAYNPYLRCPLSILSENGSDSTELQKVRIIWNEGMDFGGTELPALDNANQENTILDSEWRNIIGYVTYENFPEQEVYQFKSGVNDFNATTGPFYGLPGLGVGYTNTKYWGEIQMNFNRRIGVTMTFEVRIVNKFGVINTVTTPGINGQDFIVINDIFNGTVVGDLGLPGVGIQVRFTDTSVPPVTQLNVSSFRVVGFIGESGLEGFGGNTTLYMKPYQYQDIDTMCSNYSEYRVVGSSLTVTFQGTSFQGGKASALSYEGGNVWSNESLYSYSNISNKRESYSGEVKMGSYSYWRPSSRKQLDFKKCNSKTDPTNPFIVASGVISNVSPGELPTGVLRLKLVTLLEFISDSQLFQYRYYEEDQAALRQTRIALTLLPSSMENPLHFEKIRNFLNGVKNFALRAGQFVYDNRAAIIPIVSKLAMAAGMAL